MFLLKYFVNRFREFTTWIFLGIIGTLYFAHIFALDFIFFIAITLAFFGVFLPERLVERLVGELD